MELKHLSKNLSISESIKYGEFEYIIIYDSEQNYIYISFTNSETQKRINKNHSYLKLESEINDNLEDIKKYIIESIFEENKKLKENQISILADMKIKEILKDLVNIDIENLEKPQEQILKDFDICINKEIREQEEEKQKEENKDEIIKKFYDETLSKEIETQIKEKGLYNFLDDIIKNIHIGSNKDIIRKILVGFNVIRGAGSYLSETIAKSGAGKSLEDEIAFLNAMPKENIFRKNSMTPASFTRYEYDYFNRKIIYFGDLGNKKSFEKIEDVFDIIKVLISEGFYSRNITEKVKGNHEVTDLTLTVESIGGVYSSINNSFTKGDEQLESRTIKFTPTETDDIEDKVLNFIFESKYKESPKNKDREKAIEDLKKWHHYLRFLVNEDIKVIIPYRRVFIDYAKKSDVPKRELTQQLELFESYCILSYFDCKNINKHYIASQKQFKDYFNNISLENPLKPYENNFLKMIMAENKKYELTILNDDINADEIGVNNCFNTVLEDMNEKQSQRSLDDDIHLELDDLDYRQEKIFTKKLINYYGLNSRSSKFTKKRVFFTYNSLKAVYKSNNNFKNIEDVAELLRELNKKGYLEKLDFKLNNQNIYYLTPKCKDIIISFDLNKEDIVESNNFLKEMGVLE